MATLISKKNRAKNNKLKKGYEKSHSLNHKYPKTRLILSRVNIIAVLVIIISSLVIFLPKINNFVALPIEVSTVDGLIPQADSSEETSLPLVSEIKKIPQKLDEIALPPVSNNSDFKSKSFAVSFQQVGSLNLRRKDADNSFRTYLLRKGDYLIPSDQIISQAISKAELIIKKCGVLYLSAHSHIDIVSYYSSEKSTDITIDLFKGSIHLVLLPKGKHQCQISLISPSLIAYVSTGELWMQKDIKGSTVKVANISSNVKISLLPALEDQSLIRKISANTKFKKNANSLALKHEINYAVSSDAKQLASDKEVLGELKHLNKSFQQLSKTALSSQQQQEYTQANHPSEYAPIRDFQNSSDLF